ncbi:MAG: substrate-binding domain-containing protein [Anaerolineae bacterium]
MIGYLASGIDEDLSQAIWFGALDAAREQDVSLVTFVGGVLRDPVGFDAQANIAYSLASGKLDGLFAWASSIGGLVDQAEMHAFHRRYDVPTISLALPLPDVPAIMVDTYHGMRELLVHLVEVHGYRRIAFISGPETHYYVQERYRAYLDVLRDYNIAFDPDLVSLPGGWSRRAGAKAINLFLDERRLQPGFDLQAIVTTNDQQAHGALQALQQRGLRVPEDVAVVGFNDDRDSRVSTPPLTSVEMPFYRLGQSSVDMLLGLVDGGNVPEPTTLRTRVVVRQSCGCPDADVNDAAIGPTRRRVSSTDDAGPYSETNSAVVTHLPAIVPDIVSERSPRVRDAFFADVRGESPGSFLEALGEALDQMPVSTNISAWHNVISTLRRQAAPQLENESLQRAEDLWHQARVVIGKRARRREAYERIQTERRADALHEISARLATATELATLMDILADGLPRLGIPACYLSLYEQPQLYQYPLPAPEYSRLILAFDEKGRIGLEAGGRRFLTRELAPQGILPIGRHNYVVEPLYFQEHQLGFALFETGPQTGALYSALRVQISSAVRGVQLAEQNAALYHQALEAQKAAQEGQRLAEEANRLKSRFLSVVSHELLTPLVLLVGLSELMLRDSDGEKPPLPTPYRADLERIHVSAQQLGSLVRDVLDLARSEAGQLKIAQKRVDLGAVMTAAAHIGEQMVRQAGLDWQAEVPASLPPVLGDPARLYQVALNLIANAVKFTPQGQISLRVQHVDGFITVLVSDTGVGVPVEEQVAIFDEFRQSERTAGGGYGGLGIGLALCRQIVELHGGQIGVRSSGEENSGATFYITIPVLSAEAADELSQLSRSQTVLLLTERAREGSRLAQYLSEHGYDVESIGIRERPDWLYSVLASPPDALVLDAPVTKLSWELIGSLKEDTATQDIPLLFYSMYQEQDAGSMLAFDYLTKPVGIDALARVLDRYGVGEAALSEPTILIVDDDVGILELHSELIRTVLPHARVLQATNGRMALETMARENPSLVLLDLMMPGLDGFSVVQMMQSDEKLRTIPVIVLTAQVLTQADMERLNQGVEAVLSKGLFTSQETLAHVEQALSHHQRLNTDTRRVVRRAMAYIHEHYAESLTREDLAAYVGVSPRHLTRCFDEEVGIAPMAYLNRYRILQAKRLLRRGTKSIVAIASEVGFSTSAYFAEVFRREVGLSPREYQRQEAGSGK